jgi:hypothetical protein
MRLIGVLVLIAALFGASSPGQANAQVTTTIGPGGTPQFDRDFQAMRYSAAAPLELGTYLTIVLAEVDALRLHPSLAEVKSSPLRKRLLDLRLMMDFNAFLYSPPDFDRYREQVDQAYETLGAYKDLSDQQDLTGQPPDKKRQAERLKAMDEALDPFRASNSRRELQQFLAAPAVQPGSLSDAELPRLWRISGTVPNGDLSSIANAALLSSRVLSSLERDGLLIDDILNLDKEAHFHDIRKALRSSLVLADMFPWLAEATISQRQPLAEIVDAYGEVNDRSIAYHDAQDRGGKVKTRAGELQASFATAQKLVKTYVENGQLDDYVARLALFLSI